MEIDRSWIPTLLCAINDGIKYNDRLRQSETVKDPADIEEWMLQIFQFKQYLGEKLRSDKEMLEQCKKYLE